MEQHNNRMATLLYQSVDFSTPPRLHTEQPANCCCCLSIVLTSTRPLRQCHHIWNNTKGAGRRRRRTIDCWQHHCSARCSQLLLSHLDVVPPDSSPALIMMPSSMEQHNYRMSTRFYQSVGCLSTPPQQSLHNNALLPISLSLVDSMTAPLYAEANCIKAHRCRTHLFACRPHASIPHTNSMTHLPPD
jgi:hypothetical protein